MASGLTNEADRLAALLRREILDTAPEPQFDAVCRTAQRLLDVPVAFVSLADRNRPWLKAYAGPIGDHEARVSDFCRLAIGSDATLVVPDARRDPRFTHSPSDDGGDLRFYAAVPLTLGPGLRVGTLGVADTQPRTLTETQRLAFCDLALILATQLRMHDVVRQSEVEAQARHAREANLAHRETALNAANARLLKAERIAHVGHWEIDARTRQRIWSNEVRNIFGLAPDDEVPAIEAEPNGYHPDDRDRVRAVLHAALATCRDFEFEARVLRPTGEVRQVVVRGICDQAEDGLAQRLFGICLDVTAIKDTERKLRDSEGRFKLLVESVSDYAIYMLDPDGRVTDWNTGAERIKGYRADEVVGQHVSLFHTAEDRQRGKPAAALRAARENGRYAGEGWRVRKDGSRFWCSVVIAAMRDPAGTLVGFAKLTRDVTERRNAELRLQESEARYRLLAENITDVVIQVDLDGTRRYVSPSSKEVLGYQPEELVGNRTPDITESGTPADLDEWFDEVHGDCPEKAVSRRLCRRRDGARVWIEGVHRLIRDEAGNPAGYVASLRDITARAAIEADLRKKTVLLDQTLANMDQGLLMIDAADVIRVHNRRASELLGIPEAVLASQPTLFEMFAYQDRHGEFTRTTPGRVAQLRLGIASQSHAPYERERPDGTVLEARTVALPGGGAVRTFTDVTARKRAEQRAEHMSRHDVLTGLPNRRAFQDGLDQALRRVAGQGGSCAVLCLDLDRFKDVNDGFGHPAGDQLLMAVAERIRSVLNASDLAARMGGDEFAILVGDLAHDRDLGALARALTMALSAPCTLSSASVNVGLSIGIAIAPGDGTDPEQLVRNADFALYRAKASGRNTYRFYDVAMDRAKEDRLILEIDLAEAVKREQFELYYQPCVDAASERIVGFEALIRWRHPQRGLVSPAAFVPLAEECGLIVPIGEWALAEACWTAVGWPEPVRVAVNVSAVQFRHEDLERSVLAALAASGLSPHRLELEITESVFVEDADATLTRLARLRALGVRIALDDFGTGYSSLSYLHRFPIDKIKVDQCFIRHIEEPNTEAIVRAVVALGQARGNAITAEGVETRRQFEGARNAGCTEVQGYLFSRPVPAAEVSSLFLTLLARQRRRPSGREPKNRPTNRVA